MQCAMARPGFREECHHCQRMRHRCLTSETLIRHTASSVVDIEAEASRLAVDLQAS